MIVCFFFCSSFPFLLRVHSSHAVLASTITAKKLRPCIRSRHARASTISVKKLHLSIFSFRERLCGASPQHYPSPVRQWHQLAPNPWESCSELMVDNLEGFCVQLILQIDTRLDIICRKCYPALSEIRYQDHMQLDGLLHWTSLALST